MNSIPNSDSEQCTESKLSRVHSAPTLGPACAHTTRALHRVASLAQSCHRPGLAISWPCVDTRPRTLLRAISQAPRPCRAPVVRVAALLRRVVGHWRGPPLARPLVVLRPKRLPPPPSPSLDTNLYRDSPWPAKARFAHAAARPCSRAGRIVALPHRVMGLAWSYRGHALAAPRPVSLALCHDTIHCIVAQMGSSPSSFVMHPFSFHIIFFSHIYISFSSRTK